MIATLIFIFTYVAFCVGRVPGLRSDRLAAAIIGGTAVIVFRVLSLEEAKAAIDAPSLGLLFGMMVLSASLEVSGAFAWLGWWVARRAKTPLGLLAATSVVTALLSAFLINDVVCLAFAPLVLHVTKALDREPRPYLLALATSSNIGSVATMTGNPQNILIGSLSGLSYGQFAAALAPIAALALLANVVIVWALQRKALGGPFETPTRFKRPRTYPRWIWKASIVLVLVLGALALGVPPTLASLSGAAVMLLTRAVKPKRLYSRVDWALLALFMGLFVVVAGVEKVGLTDRLFARLEPLGAGSVVGMAAIATLLSNVVSNVPAVMLMKSIVPGLPNPGHAWLVLAMASTFAGNLTLPGSLATVIVVEKSRGRAEIGFFDFLKVGLPTGLTSLAIGVIWLTYVAK